MHKNRKTSGIHANTRKPTKKCAMKMKETRKKKNDGRLKYFLMEGRSLRIRRCGKFVPWISNNFRSTILDTLKVLRICLVNE